MTLESKFKNKRLIGLDYLKVLAILMVITLHVRLYRFDFIESGKLFNVVQYPCGCVWACPSACALVP